MARQRRLGNFLYIFTQYECMTCLEFEHIINQGKEAAIRIVFFPIFLVIFYFLELDRKEDRAHKGCMY